MRGSGTIASDGRGVASVEFAMIAPVLALAVLGMFEVGYNLYVQAQLQGSVQQAARSSTIENAVAAREALDARVASAVRRIAPAADTEFRRLSYASFSDAGQPEDFNDINGDGRCNDNEQFEDANGNGVWDVDRGREGFGGARDVVLYQVTIRYPRPFGVGKLLGLGDTVTYEASTVLRNQPWDEQHSRATIRQCP